MTIIDHRTYMVKPGRLKEYLHLYETEAFALQKSYLGRNIGWYVSNDIGPLSQVVHLWEYEGLDDRAKRRAALMADPKWNEFLAKAMPLLDSMENKILQPTSFFEAP